MSILTLGFDFPMLPSLVHNVYTPWSSYSDPSGFDFPMLATLQYKVHNIFCPIITIHLSFIFQFSCSTRCMIFFVWSSPYANLLVCYFPISPTLQYKVCNILCPIIIECKSSNFPFSLQYQVYDILCPIIIVCWSSNFSFFLK